MSLPLLFILLSQSWVVVEGKTDFEDKPYTIASILSEDGRALLFLRCLDNETQIAIDIGRSDVRDAQQVHFRFDSDVAFWEIWGRRDGGILYRTFGSQRRFPRLFKTTMRSFV